LVYNLFLTALNAAQIVIVLILGLKQFQAAKVKTLYSSPVILWMQTICTALFIALPMLFFVVGPVVFYIIIFFLSYLTRFLTAFIVLIIGPFAAVKLPRCCLFKKEERKRFYTLTQSLVGD
jgi:hypothetical protein